VIPSRDDDDDVPWGDDSEDETIVAMCHEALERFEHGDSAGAKARAMEAVALDDEHPFPMFVLGLIAEAEGDLISARDLSELALRSAVTNAEAIQLRAQVHLRLNEFDDAERLLRFGIVHNPGEAQLHEGLARVLLAQGRSEDAVAAAHACLQLEPGNPGAHAVRGAALDQRGDRDALLAALRQTVQLHPEDPWALVELAGAEAEHGNLRRARTLLARAQRLEPDDRQIVDLRRVLEESSTGLLLRPLPRVLDWVREFPGGLVGLIAGLVIAALPVHALTGIAPELAVPARLVLAGWAGIAAYAWIGPSVMNDRLTRHAAQVAASALLDDLGNVDEPAPTADRVLDAAHLALATGDRGGASRLLRVCATACDLETAHELVGAAERLDRWPMRIICAPPRIPGTTRFLAAVGLGLLMTAPLLAGRVDGTTTSEWYYASGALLGIAFVLSWLGNIPTRALRVED
jgi:Flp pilus assembly protein TadD